MEEDELQNTEDVVVQPEQRETGSIYDKLSTVVDERDVELVDDDDDIEGHKTLSEKMTEAPNLSDIQTAFKQLYPKSGTTYLDDLQVSRVFPDVYNPLSRIFVKDLLQKSNGDMSVAEAIARVNTPMSIGIDGEGRIDAIAMMGKASDAEVEKERTKNLGIV